MTETTELTPVERLAAYRALQDALGQIIAGIETEVAEFHRLTKGKSFETELGTVTWTRGRTTVAFDEDALLAWAQDNAAWEVETITRVRPTLKRQFEVVDGAVIFKPTGEQVDFATVRTGADHPTVKLTADARTRAQAALADRHPGSGETTDIAHQLLELP